MLSGKKKAINQLEVWKKKRFFLKITVAIELHDDIIYDLPFRLSTDFLKLYTPHTMSQ